MTEDRRLSTCEYGGHEAAVQVTDRVSDCIDTAMHPVQTSDLHSLRHSSTTQTRLFKLPKRDHTMLPACNRGD